MSKLRNVAIVVVVLLAPSGAASSDPAWIECLIVPHTTMRLSTPVEGQLESLTIDRGDRVEAGQVVANLESSVERAQFELARARVEYDRRRRARIESLFQENVISEHELEAVRRETELSEKELERTAAVVKRRVIRSPIDGVVVKRLLEPGEYSEPSGVLEIARTGTLRVEAYAPAELFRRIELHREAEVMPAGFDGPALRAKVTVIDPVVDPGSGTFGVRLELPNEDGLLPAGIGCQVRFTLAPKLQITVR
jgi:RND family efflux transporter MFP subunit